METETTTFGEVYTGPLTLQVSSSIQSRYCACGRIPQLDEMVRTAASEHNLAAIVRCTACGLGRRSPKVHGRTEPD